MPITHEGPRRADGRRFAVIASRFNEFIVDKLVQGALDGLRKAGVGDADVEIFRCPGAFEIPGLARRVVATGRFDGLVCLGTVIRGDTPHFDLVVNHSAAGIARIATEAKVSVGFGVLACNNIEQAMERSGSTPETNRGYDAAIVAVEMATLYASLAKGRPRATTSGKSRGARRATR